MSGYTNCACRDCFDIAMDDNLCHACAKAGCVRECDHERDAPHAHQRECQRDDAYFCGYASELLS